MITRTMWLAEVWFINGTYRRAVAHTEATANLWVLHRRKEAKLGTIRRSQVSEVIIAPD